MYSLSIRFAITIQIVFYCALCFPRRPHADMVHALPLAVTDALPTLVPALLKRFSSAEGYALYDDVLPTRALSRLALSTH